MTIELDYDIGDEVWVTGRNHEPERAIVADIEVVVMIFKLIKVGDYCKKNLCVAGCPKCERCPRNFGLKIEHLYRKDHKGGWDRRYVKCASWLSIWLAEAIKSW